MMRRFICLCLVPLLLLGQGSFSVHAHGPGEGAEPDSHASKPHFHLGDHESSHSENHDVAHSHTLHTHRDRSDDADDVALPTTVTPSRDHDANAVYLPEAVTLARSGNPLSVVPAKLIAQTGIFGTAIIQSNDRPLRLGLIRGQPASVFDAACPIYLRARSLRI